MTEQTENVAYTPGPWRQHQTDGKTYASVRGSSGRCVADCGSRSDEVAQANARLIASAPALLAALAECVTDEGAACFASGDGMAAHARCTRRLDYISRTARAAIASAKGGAA